MSRVVDDANPTHSLSQAAISGGGESRILGSNWRANSLGPHKCSPLQSQSHLHSYTSTPAIITMCSADCHLEDCMADAVEHCHVHSRMLENTLREGHWKLRRDESELSSTYLTMRVD